MDQSLKELSARFLAERHRLMAFIYGLVRDRTVAEDLFQEVWIRLHDAVEKGTEIEKLAPWCRGVARNLVLHHWRRSAKDHTVDSEMVALAEQAFEETDGHLADRRQALAECIRALPAKSRDMLRMKYEQGLTMADVGGALKRSASAIMMAISRVRRGLAQCVTRRLEIMETQ